MSATPEDRYRVVDTNNLVGSIAVWVLGWYAATAMLQQGELVFHGGSLLASLLNALVLALCMTLGPLGLWSHRWWLRAAGNVLTVGSWVAPARGRPEAVVAWSASADGRRTVVVLTSSGALVRLGRAARNVDKLVRDLRARDTAWAREAREITGREGAPAVPAGDSPR